MKLIKNLYFSLALCFGLVACGSGGKPSSVSHTEYPDPVVKIIPANSDFNYKVEPGKSFDIIVTFDAKVDTQTSKVTLISSSNKMHLSISSFNFDKNHTQEKVNVAIDDDATENQIMSIQATFNDSKLSNLFTFSIFKITPVVNPIIAFNQKDLVVNPNCNTSIRLNMTLPKDFNLIHPIDVDLNYTGENGKVNFIKPSNQKCVFTNDNLTCDLEISVSNTSDKDFSGKIIATADQSLKIDNAILELKVISPSAKFYDKKSGKEISFIKTIHGGINTTVIMEINGVLSNEFSGKYNLKNRNVDFFILSTNECDIDRINNKCEITIRDNATSDYRYEDEDTLNITHLNNFETNIDILGYPR